MKTLPVLSFSRSFLASPHRACHERGDRAQTRTTGEKQCGALVTVLVCFTQINRLTPSPHVLSSRSNEVVRLVVLRYDWPTMVLAFSNWRFPHRTCRYDVSSTVTPPRLRRERGEKSSVIVRVRVLACRPSIWSTAACRVSHGRRHDEAARPSTSRCGTMPMALMSAAAQVQTLETRARACTVQVVTARESSFVLACQRTVSSCQRTVRYASFSACAPALRENRLPSQKPPRPYSSKPSPPHWSASVIAFC